MNGHTCCIFWLGIAFSTFFTPKSWKGRKSKKIEAKFSKNMFFLICTRILVGGYLYLFVVKNINWIGKWWLIIVLFYFASLLCSFFLFIFSAWKTLKKLILTSVGVCSTQTLVKIYSTHLTIAAHTHWRQNQRIPPALLCSFFYFNFCHSSKSLGLLSYLFF